MTESIRNSLLLLAIICPVYIAIIGSCCSDQCSDSNPCTSECYAKPSGGCPSPAQNPYSVADGKECELTAGTFGQCTAGVCGDNECKSTGSPDLNNLKACDHPRNGGTQGICIDERCVTAGDDDECVKVSFGRVNCCEPTGCGISDGILCGGSGNSSANGTPCDPAGVLPVGQGSGSCQDGHCDVGQCTGQCVNAQCTEKSCDPSSGQCGSAQATGTSLPCIHGNGGVGSGVCVGGQCKLAGPCGVNCDDGNPCTIDSCSLAKLVNDTCPSKVCCEHEPKPAATACTIGEVAGVCDGAGTCIPTSCGL